MGRRICSTIGIVGFLAVAGCLGTDEAIRQAGDLATPQPGECAPDEWRESATLDRSTFSQARLSGTFVTVDSGASGRFRKDSILTIGAYVAPTVYVFVSGPAISFEMATLLPELSQGPQTLDLEILGGPQAFSLSVGVGRDCVDGDLFFGATRGALTVEKLAENDVATYSLTLSALVNSLPGTVDQTLKDFVGDLPAQVELTVNMIGTPEPVEPPVTTPDPNPVVDYEFSLVCDVDVLPDGVELLAEQLPEEVGVPLEVNGSLFGAWGTGIVTLNEDGSYALETLTPVSGIRGTCTRI